MLTHAPHNLTSITYDIYQEKCLFADGDEICPWSHHLHDLPILTLQVVLDQSQQILGFLLFSLHVLLLLVDAVLQLIGAVQRV